MRRVLLRIAANEVAIGLTMPHAATALLRYRLTPSAFQAATLLALEYGPENAVDAGFLDELVEPDDFEEQLRARATALAGLDRAAQVATKARTRSAFLSDLEEATARDRAEFEALTAAT